jgi:hypothetical protein
LSIPTHNQVLLTPLDAYKARRDTVNFDINKYNKNQIGLPCMPNAKPSKKKQQKLSFAQVYADARCEK